MRTLYIALAVVMLATTITTGQILVDHHCTDLRAIPKTAINQAKANLHIVYGHTSHGSQLTTGMTGLVSFTKGYGGPDYAWNRDAFMGQSLSQLCQLTGRCGYALAELHYANAFLAPEEICPVPAQTPEDAFRKGYVDRPDRRERFPWNNPYEELLHLPPEQALEYVNRMFAKYEGKYICTADPS